MSSSTLSLISALDGVGGKGHAPAALPQGMGRYPQYRRLGGPQVRSGRVRKISPPSPQRVGILTTSCRPTQHKLNTIQLEAKSGYNWTTQVYRLTATPPGSVEQFIV